MKKKCLCLAYNTEKVNSGHTACTCTNEYVYLSDLYININCDLVREGNY